MRRRFNTDLLLLLVLSSGYFFVGLFIGWLLWR